MRKKKKDDVVRYIISANLQMAWCVVYGCVYGIQTYHSHGCIYCQKGWFYEFYA